MLTAPPTLSADEHPPATTGSRLGQTTASGAAARPDDRPLRRLASDEPIPGRVWLEPDMVQALAVRDIAGLFAGLGALGMTQRRIAARTGQSQSEVSEVLAGRHVVSYDVLLRLADGLGVPRGYLGLAYHAPTHVPTYPDVLSRPVSGAAGDDRGRTAEVVRTVTVHRCVRCTADASVDVWTGHEIRLLREALRMSVREFAAHLGVSERMVSKWESGSRRLRPGPVNQAALDTALARADEASRQRFAVAAATARALAEKAGGQPRTAANDNPSPRHRTRWCSRYWIDGSSSPIPMAEPVFG